MHGKFSQDMEVRKSDYFKLVQAFYLIRTRNWNNGIETKDVTSRKAADKVKTQPNQATFFKWLQEMYKNITGEDIWWAKKQSMKR